MLDMRISIYLKPIASMHKTLNERSMVGIGVIHNTKRNEMSKHMGQVQDNPSIMCIWCGEESEALNTNDIAILEHVQGNQVMRANSRHSQCTWHVTSTITKQEIIIVLGIIANMVITSNISTKLANTHTSSRVNHHV